MLFHVVGRSFLPSLANMLPTVYILLYVYILAGSGSMIVNWNNALMSQPVCTYTFNLRVHMLHISCEE